jgi:hypothetical protein
LNLRILVFLQGGVYAEEQNIPRVEAGVDAVKVLQRPHHQAGAHQNDHRKPHLHDDERLIEMPPPAGVRSSSRKRRGVFLERRRQTQPRAAECRREAKKDSGEK